LFAGWICDRFVAIFIYGDKQNYQSGDSVTIELVLPRPGYESSYGEYIRELGDEERYPFPLDFEHKDFPALLRRLNNFATGVDLPAGFVPSSTYWLIDGTELIGVSNLRHYLNDRLRLHGGHIGLGVRPSRRGHGFGSLLLARTIHEARKRGIAEVQVHRHKSNVASARMIVRSGGSLESEGQDEGSHEVIQRYSVAFA
jgi:predicted acetyltransferase